MRSKINVQQPRRLPNAVSVKSDDCKNVVIQLYFNSIFCLSFSYNRTDIEHQLYGMVYCT